MPSHDVFTAHVVLDLRAFQGVAQVLELPPDVHHRVAGGRIGLVHPRCGRGLQHQDPVDLLAVRRRGRQPREVVGHHVIVVPPRRVVRKRLRMVAFAGASDRDVRQVFVQRINAQHDQPVADPLHVLEPQIPAAGAVGFAQGAPPSQLVGDAGQFLHRAGVAKLSVDFLAVLVHQVVDGRPLVPGVHRHVIAAVAGVRPAVFPVVPGEFQVVPFAVFVTRLGPAFDELFQQQLEIIVPDALPIAHRQVQTGQMVDQIVTPTLAERLRQMIRPMRGTERRQVRLVGEPSGDAAAELLAEPLAIRLHRDLDKFLGHARLQQIHIRTAARPRRVGGSCQPHDHVAVGSGQLAFTGRGGHVRRDFAHDGIHAEHVVAQVRHLVNHLEPQASTP